MIITIDGPAGTGKSTVAKKIAEQLSFALLDTGALYRAVACALVRGGIDYSSEQAVAEFLAENPLDTLTEGGEIHYVIAGIDTSPHIRTQQSGAVASIISTYPSVRLYLLPVQRSFAIGQNVVCEGRDMGTTVFPQAELKIFLTASPEVRAKRRFLEQTAHSLEEVRAEIAQRDLRDSTRAHSPLSRAEDAVLIDSSSRSVDEVVHMIAGLARAMPHYELFPHQADIGIRGIGRTISEAFSQAALALTAVITNPATVVPKRTVLISCSDEDHDTLFFDFLNEVIYQMAKNHMLFSKFDVSISGPSLNALLYGETVSPERHAPAAEIKAATYYELLVQKQANDSWLAQCVVDV